MHYQTCSRIKMKLLTFLASNYILLTAHAKFRAVTAKNPAAEAQAQRCKRRRDTRARTLNPEAAIEARSMCNPLCFRKMRPWSGTQGLEG